MSVTIEFDICSYWHAGTGRGDGTVTDAAVARTPEGLPYLPGRTVKGLLRDAVELGEAAGAVVPGTARRWFGTDGVDPALDSDERERALEEARFRTAPGTLRVGSATLPAAWRDWARGGNRNGPPLEIQEFFRRYATTALDERGIARDQTLRVIELAVPLVLTATVHGLSEDDVRLLEAVLPWIRCLGSHRNRGLGRVDVRLAKGG